MYRGTTNCMDTGPTRRRRADVREAASCLMVTAARSCLSVPPGMDGIRQTMHCSLRMGLPGVRWEAVGLGAGLGGHGGRVQDGQGRRVRMVWGKGA